VLGYTHLKDLLPGVLDGSKSDGVTLVVYGPEKEEVFRKLTLYGKDKFAFTTKKGKWIACKCPTY
jgi:hypothetical protein